jgi:hypothetical protein
MENVRIPRKAYLMLLGLDEKGKQNWVSSVRLFLMQNGFGEVWYNQGVGNVKHFLSVLKERLIDCRWQNWHEHVTESSRFRVYMLLSNTSLEIPKYLKMNLNKHLIFTMTRFKFGISNLLVHYYRYRDHSPHLLLCPLCAASKDDELHFILCCPILEPIRKDCIPAKYYREPCLFKLSLLFNCNNDNTMRNLCYYISKAFKVREILTS